MDNKFKVSLYIRVSTGRQAQEGDSLEEQEKELKKFCEYKNYLIHKTHIERGRSAKDTNRPEYQKLLTDIRDKKINAIVVKKLDRLSRSLMDFEEFMKVALDNEVEFISLKENFDTTNAMGKAMLRVALVFAQLEREQTSERVIDVMAFRAEQGLYNGGTPPYGYDVINKELVPHKQEKKIIEMIFNNFLETTSTASIARELNAIGIKNRNGLLWDKRRIEYILKNQIYTGQIKWNNQLFDSVHQPLITKDVFDKVINIFKDNKSLGVKSVIGGVLKGFIYCGCCNNPLTSNYTRKKNKTYHFYRCISTLTPQNRRRYHCVGGYYNMQEVERKVYEKILNCGSEESLLAIKHELEHDNNIIEKQITAFNNELNLQEVKLETIKNKKEKYLDSLIASDLKKNERKMVNEKIEEFSLEEKQLKANIYRLQFDVSNKAQAIQTIDQLKEELIFFKFNYTELSIIEMSQWLKRNIEAIIYSDKEVIIRFKIIKVVR